MPSIDKIFQLKIRLEYSRPPIWRRVLVSSGITLHKLHDVIQAAMGWTDSHLHMFVVGERRYGVPDPEWDVELGDERKVTLAELLRRPKDRILYEYDFGDGWLHVVELEKSVPPSQDQQVPCVVAGRRACPPEDCGGPPGYARLLHVLGQSDSPERRELLEWVGEEFDPAAFDLASLNRRLPR